MLYDVARRARAEGDDDALTRAALSFSHFGASAAAVDPVPEQLAVIEHALAVCGEEPSPIRARLVIELAGQVSGSAVETSVALAEQALSMARRIGDPALVGSVLLGARHVGRHPSRLPETMGIGLELEALGDRLSSLALTLAGVSVQTLALFEQGELARWRQSQQRFERLLGDRTMPQFQLIALINRAANAVLDGQFAAAEELATAMGTLARSIGHSAQATAGPTILISCRLRGRDAELVGPLEQTVQLVGGTSVFRFALAAVQARAGAVAEARRTLDTLRGDQYRVPPTYGWSLAIAELAEAAEVVGDLDAATHVLTKFAPYSGGIATSGAGINRPLDQALAQAALAVGDNMLAERYATSAVLASRQRTTPTYLCRELVFLAEVRRRAGAAAEEIRPLVDEARAIAGRLGADAVFNDLDRYGLLV